MWSYLASALVGVVGVPLILDRIYPWLRSDLYVFYKQIQVLIKFVKLTKTGMITDVLERQAKVIPNKTFLIFQDNNYSYKYMNEQVNRVSHVAFDKLGLRNGDCVALLAYNGPEFIWTFYGLAKLGVRVAFLNFNLRSKSLTHSINVSGAKAIFIGSGDDLIEAIEDIRSDIASDVEIYTKGQDKAVSGYMKLDDLLQHASTTNPEYSMRGGLKLRDKIAFIYTSGTTGLPKAAVITQLKVHKAACLMKFLDITENDIIYTPLPLYHSAAGLIGLGNAVVHGATIVIRSKFSAREFWTDCCRHNVTIIQYIGELCRYLVNTPPNPKEKLHKIRFAFGNGLRKDVWTQFQERFNIPRIGEFYAATEGNAGFVNVLNIPGSVGRLSPILNRLYPTFFIKYDFETAEPLRNSDGYCERVNVGEPGLLVAAMKKNFEYDGYQGNEKVSKKKIICDVFKKGDVFINSGDLFILDKNYNIYFCDRIGDTFRWKGENVSTIEVANAMSSTEFVQDANVYGVSIPGHDGRAGMAAILLNGKGHLTDSDLADLFARCSNDLALYAIPRFIRIPAELKMTSTHKQIKSDLVKESFDPSSCNGDPLFYADFKGKTFKPIDTNVYQDIITGNIKL